MWLQNEKRSHMTNNKLSAVQNIHPQSIQTLMKRILLIMALIATSIITRANDVTNLVIKLKAGNETVLSLDSNPVITFEGEYLNVRNDDASFSFPIADIDHYGVSSTSGVKEKPCLPYYSNGQVSINDLPQGSKIQVCTMDGKAIKTIVADGIGSVSFNLRDLPKGTYIIHAVSNSFKVVNK